MKTPKEKRIKTLRWILVIVALGISINIKTGLASACTDFQIVTKDGTVIIGRSMELDVTLETRLLVYPRGEKFTSITPTGKPALGWTNKYGFIAGVGTLQEMLKAKEALMDGMNEKGLSIEGLELSDAKYQEVTDADADKVLGFTDFAAWVIGNFAAVYEVKQAIRTVRVWGPEQTKDNPFVMGFHVALHDVQGKNLVIEYINGELKIYDNPVGVMTNAPTFDWQIRNLELYASLSPFYPKPQKIRGMTLDDGTGGPGLAG